MGGLLWSRRLRSWDGYPGGIGTRPPSGGDRAHTLIAFAGDTTLASVQGLAKRIGDAPDAIVFCGDVANELRRAPRPRHFRRWRRRWGEAGDRVYPVPGNHDLGADGSLGDWWEGAASRLGRAATWFERRSFVLTLPHVTVLGVDSSRPAEGEDPQFAWLAEACRSAATPWRILAIHQPIEPVSLHLSHPMADAARERVVALAEQVGARLVVCGHEHLYARAEGVWSSRVRAQVTAGGGGAALYPVVRPGLRAAVSRHHHLEIELEPDVLRGRAIAWDGDCIDAWHWSDPLA
jgi:3',5'-cyclic AMP phosphodiesterase CpdA